MVADQTHRDSFLIRIWRERDQAHWRGWVQHIRTGDSTSIQDLDELQDFFERYSGKLTKLHHKGLK